MRTKGRTLMRGVCAGMKTCAARAAVMALCSSTAPVDEQRVVAGARGGFGGAKGTSARVPSARAESATPCAWLPAEAVTTPLARCRPGRVQAQLRRAQAPGGPTLVAVAGGRAGTAGAGAGPRQVRWERGHEVVRSPQLEREHLALRVLALHHRSALHGAAGARERRRAELSAAHLDKDKIPVPEPLGEPRHLGESSDARDVVYCRAGDVLDVPAPRRERGTAPGRDPAAQGRCEDISAHIRAARAAGGIAAAHATPGSRLHSSFTQV